VLSAVVEPKLENLGAWIMPGPAAARFQFLPSTFQSTVQTRTTNGEVGRRPLMKNGELHAREGVLNARTWGTPPSLRP